MKTPYDFSNKVALVTGAASGIGLACAQTFASGGARVIVADRQRDVGEAAVAGIRQAGGQADFLEVDVADPASVQAMVDWVEKGQPPDRILARAAPNQAWFPGRSRPLCPYPAFARYKGAGPVEDHGSFECVRP